MKQNEDGKTVRAMDVLFPKIGEIIGGSQREENLDKLRAGSTSWAFRKRTSGGTSTRDDGAARRTAASGSDSSGCCCSSRAWPTYAT